MKLLIKNGKVIDPKNKIDEQFDILIQEGKIAQVEKSITCNDAKTFDAKGLMIMPGFIDLHTHLRQPGQEYKEDFETGQKAAIKGGFTSICAMPNTKPPADNRSVIEFVMNETKKLNLANVFPIACITKEQAGKELVEMGELKSAGVLALSDDGYCVSNSATFQQALLYAKSFDLLVIEHCEDHALFDKGVMNEGFLSTRLGLRGIPRISESIMVERDIQIAEYNNCRIHLAHISTKESVNAIRAAKQRGVQVTCEVTPHHFTLTEDAVKSFNTYAKVNPPLRTQEDLNAILKGISDGTIDCIATDHAPHIDKEKIIDFEHAAFGIIGLQSAFSLAYEYLVTNNTISLLKLTDLLSYTPAQIIGLKKTKGAIEPGFDADITLVDLNKEWTYTKNTIVSKSTNTPFLDTTLKGSIHSVFVNGKCILEDGLFL